MQKNIDKKLRFIVLSLELNRFTISIRHESTSWSPWWQMKHAQNIILPRSRYKNDSFTHLIWIMNTTHLCMKKKVFFAANRWIKVNITFLSCKHQKNSGYTQSNCTHGSIDFLGTTSAKKKVGSWEAASYIYNMTTEEINPHAFWIWFQCIRNARLIINKVL